MVLRFFLLVFLSFLPFHEGKRSFDGNKVLRVLPETNEQLQFLQNLHKTNHDLDFWTEPRAIGLNVDIHVENNHVSEIREKLNSEGFHYDIWIEDVQKLIEMENQTSQDFYSMYHSYEEVIVFLNDISKKYPDLTTLVNIGKSYENRDLLAIKITSSKNPGPKKAIWFDSCIHAREWITTATILYMVGQLVEKYGVDDSVTNLVDNLEIFVLPIFNPDGYSFTWTDNRAWRKTRSLNSGSNCVGTDPNRNWAFKWGGEGASKDPCSDSFMGSEAFSEIEVKTVGEYITNAGNFKGYINFHSYSQLWMCPWGYTAALPEDFDKQNELSKKCVTALSAIHNTVYKIGPIATIIYPASGSSIDYTYGVSGIVYSFGVELRDTGTFGFLLPPDQIIPSGEETFAAVKVWANEILSGV